MVSPEAQSFPALEVQPADGLMLQQQCHRAGVAAAA